MIPLALVPEAARRFMRRALLLDAPVPDIGTALAHHGYIQIDPINVTGRMHDLILRNRVRGYREGGLMRHLHGENPTLRPAQRTAFEHHIPSAGILVALTLDAWPHLQAAMRARQHRTSSWSGRLSPRQKELVPHLLAEIAARGPSCSEDFTDSGRARSFWGASSQAKTTLQKLFSHGRLLIARRGDGNRRYYDLPERVLPARVLTLPEPRKTESARWEALLKLRQRRLVRLKKAELPLVEDLVQPVELTDADCPPLFMLKSDVPLLSEIENLCQATAGTNTGPAAAGNGEESKIVNSLRPHLLAPLDPLIYDRRLTSALWNFDYTWEAYVPPARRKRGYYALPVLAGLEIVGHVDPKADREKGRLRIMSRQVRRGHRVASAVAELARWLSLRR